MTLENELDRELDALCFRAAVELLDQDDPEADLRLVYFANEIIVGGRMKNENDIESTFGEILRQIEASEVVRASDEISAGEFIGDFVGELCNAPILIRSNSRKAAKFGILFSAANTLSVAGEDEGELADKRRDFWEQFSLQLGMADWPLWEGDHDEFQRAIVAAFESGVKDANFSFAALAQQIRKEEADVEIQRIRRSLGLNVKRPAGRAVNSRTVPRCPGVKESGRGHL
jgi:hypothetical protein